MAWQFNGLRMFGYNLIVSDCPHDFENYSDAGTLKGADPHYPVMSLEEIQDLRVGELARGDCLLLYWGSGCMLPQHIETIAKWGFTFKSEMIWRKVTDNGKVRMRTGYRVRTMHEPILVATIGNPKHKAFPSIFDGVAREHSRKPEEFYSLINEHCPDLHLRADLFSALQGRDGWEEWGDPRKKPLRGFEDGTAIEATAPALAEKGNKPIPNGEGSISGLHCRRLL